MPASTSCSAFLPRGVSLMSWPPTTRSAKAGRATSSSGACAVTQPVGAESPEAIAARPRVAVVATDPRAPTNQMPVRPWFHVDWWAERCIVAPGPVDPGDRGRCGEPRASSPSTGLRARGGPTLAAAGACSCCPGRGRGLTLTPLLSMVNQKPEGSAVESWKRQQKKGCREQRSSRHPRHPLRLDRRAGTSPSAVSPRTRSPARRRRPRRPTTRCPRRRSARTTAPAPRRRRSGSARPSPGGPR